MKVGRLSGGGGPFTRWRRALGVALLASSTLAASSTQGTAEASPTAKRAPGQAAGRLRPTSTQLPNGSLASISCPATGVCVAAGSYRNSAGTEIPLVEKWKGGHWSVQDTAKPQDAAGSALDGVTCTTGDACTGVGFYDDNAGTEVPLAEAWNGTTWKIKATLDPAGAVGSVLEDVACVAADACTAVGSDDTSAGTETPLAETWNGTTWTIQTIPNPSGATNTSLDSISCTNADACTAVGSDDTSAGTETPLAETWNGTTWTIQTIPNPSGATNTSLDSISCTNADACTAVGSDDTSAGTETPLAETWNGTTWTIQTIPNPSGATNTSLDSISCTNANACTAVGSDDTSAGTETPLAETWNGTTWTIQTIPNPSGATNTSLDSISCTNANACTAVGSDDTSAGTETPLAETWNGTTWTIQTTAEAGGAVASVLGSVSCSAANACIAVGYSGSVGAEVTLAEQWNGIKWAIQTAPNPNGALTSFLDGVSCAPDGTCFAVGAYQDSSGNEVTLAEKWDGSTWGIQSTPDPSGALASSLDGVSCPAKSVCTAVGSSTSGAGVQTTLAEAWDGTNWTIQATPDPASEGNELDGVSCTAAKACVAVGTRENGGKTGAELAEVWNGSTWTVQTTPAPYGVTGHAVLQGVWCIAATTCTAVGSYNDSSDTEVTLAQKLLGATWTIQPTPKGLNGYLNATSCSGVADCVAVGSYRLLGVQLTLAEVRTGQSWTVQATPNPAGATHNVLDGVSCPAPNACVAVGSRDEQGHLRTLVEAWDGTTWVIQSNS